MLEKQGFTVKGEVKGCDIAAVKGEQLWVIELKRHLSIDLLYQAMSRLSITPFVFAAIPRPKNGDLRNAKKLLKKLEIGLITVALDSPVKYAEIILYPKESNKPGKSGKKAVSIRKEIEGRRSDTPGGSTRTPIITAYRERSIKIACILEQAEDLSAAELIQQHDCEKDTGSILQRNYYGWFTRVAKGRYALSSLGRQFLEENNCNDVVIYYKQLKR